MKQAFFKYQAQTSCHPMGLEVSHAKGSLIYDIKGKEYIDFVAGIAVCNLGHCHEDITKAITQQAQQYLHVMVYGEFITQPASEFAKHLVNHLPKPLDNIYFTNSGTEAVEGAMKLCKRATGKRKIVAMLNSYHGSTQGALSLMSDAHRRINFEPLLPITYIEANKYDHLHIIDSETACVITELIQGSNGCQLLDPKYLASLKKRCEDMGALLVFDEVQTGFGRTGYMFLTKTTGVIPDVLILGKAISNGLPIGAFCANKSLMDTLSHNPELGHTTTFGGNPVVTSAGIATIKALEKMNLTDEVIWRETLLRKHLQHPFIECIVGKGLMLSVVLKSEDIANELILRSLKKGLILFWFFFKKNAIRISPPLNISKEEIEKGCNIILHILNDLSP